MNNDFKTVQKLEFELISLDVRKNIDRLETLLSEDFEECGKSGNIFNKEDVIYSLLNEDYQKISLSNFRFVQISNDSILVKYDSVCNGAKAHRISVWVKVNSDWQILYHQGTVF